MPNQRTLNNIFLGAVVLIVCVSTGFKTIWAQPTSSPMAAVASSTLQTIATSGKSSGHAIAVYKASGYFEAPNWSRDGHTLLFDQGGAIKTVPASAPSSPESVVPEAIDTGAATRCSGSHGLSSDGKLLAISCSMPGVAGRQIFVVPIAGGTPRQITHCAGCNFHSWSPDGKTMLYTQQGNIFAVDVKAGEDRALTTGTSISDDPDYSADGQWIYFNSDRGVGMQIWRMRPDGSGAEAITHDGRVNWTPHPSPDGRTLVYQSYEPGTVGHPANRKIELRLMDLKTRKMRTLATIIGGTGSMNVSSWAPDGRRLAFVSYQLKLAKTE